MNKTEVKSGSSPNTGKGKPKYAPLILNDLGFAKGHDEELMGRHGLALLNLMRMARLREAGKRAAKP